MIAKFKGTVQQVMLSTKSQIYIEPCPALRRYIAHYTVSYAKDSIIPDSLTLIPDASGCLIFTYDGASLTSKLWGATTKTVIVENNANNCPMRLFIEFLPGGLFCITGIKQTDLTDLQLPIGQVNDRLHTLVAAAFERAESLASFIDMLNSIFLSFIKNRTIPQALCSAIDNINRFKGCLAVKELADREFYSERHLNRIFNECLGMNVKTFSAIVRINYLLPKMNDGLNRPVDIAQYAGFYDQAHFIHAFKSICGTTPKKYFENMSEFYNEPFKFRCMI